MALGGDIPFALMLNGSAVTKASYRMIVRNCLNGVIRGMHIRQSYSLCGGITRSLYPEAVSSKVHTGIGERL